VKDITPKVKKELDEFNYLYQDHENRVYDINSVLKNSKENRKEKDALEEKRNLKNTNYNILASLNQDELEKYRNEKKQKNIRRVIYEDISCYRRSRIYRGKLYSLYVPQVW